MTRRRVDSLSRAASFGAQILVNRGPGILDGGLAVLLVVGVVLPGRIDHVKSSAIARPFLLR